MNLNAFHPTQSNSIRQKSYGMTHGTIFPTNLSQSTVYIQLVGSCFTGFRSRKGVILCFFTHYALADDVRLREFSFAKRIH